MISIIAKIPVKEEKLNDAIEVFKEFFTEVAKEEGTLSYTLNVSKKEPFTLVVLERYKDMESFTAHGATPHMKAFGAKVAEFIAGKMEVIKMDELASI
ncbi:MAG: putative quinol monooxygenase [Thermodesulfobacteriota bacterium]